MEITVNGDKTVIEAMSVLAYLEHIEIDPKAGRCGTEP